MLFFLPFTGEEACWYNNQKACPIGEQTCTLEPCQTYYYASPTAGFPGNMINLIFGLCLPPASVTLENSDIVRQVARNTSLSTSCPPGFSTGLGFSFHWPTDYTYGNCAQDNSNFCPLVGNCNQTPCNSYTADRKMNLLYCIGKSD